jgi:non-haem Fe2+, alpha-ketoglutarate-dependent halogenase
MASAGLQGADVDRYRRDGYLAPVAALDESEAGTIRSWLAAFEAGPGASRRERREAYLRLKPHLLFPELDAVVRHARILDAVEAIIGPDIFVWSSSFMIKDAGDGAYASWHQDSHGTRLQGNQMVSAWIALEEVDTGNGAMRVIPRSHHDGHRPHGKRRDMLNLVILGEQIDAVDEDAAVDIVLRPGEMSLHHLHVIHGSPPNTSDRSRIGYAIRYFPTWMNAEGGLSSALLVRGEDEYGFHEKESPPVSHRDPATIDSWRRALQLRRRRISALSR